VLDCLLQVRGADNVPICNQPWRPEDFCAT